MHALFAARYLQHKDHARLARFAMILALLSLLAMPLAHAQQAPEPTTPTGATAPPAAWTITVKLQGVQPKRKGRINCALFSAQAPGSARAFPMNPRGAVGSVDVRVGGATHACTFTVPGPGAYAVSVMHDENGNGRVDTSMLGFPKEGWATSNNVKPTFRAPTFAESRVQVRQATTTIAVSMHY